MTIRVAINGFGRIGRKCCVLTTRTERAVTLRLWR